VSPQPRSLRRLITEEWSCLQAADAFQAMHDAARTALQRFNPDLLTNSPHADELRRLAEMVADYNTAADDVMEEIMERFTPEQYEAAMSR
jgi:hypothetical protein